MLTQEQVLTEIREGGKGGGCIDGRDYARLSSFFPLSEMATFGVSLKEGVDPVKYAEEYQPRPWTREEVLKQFREDVAFGFEKALNKRGLSAGMMFEVVSMWLWVLDDDLAKADEHPYAQYGLPLFKAAALRYGFDNPIGDDAGDEFKYSAEADHG
jgi:hypothetical protein